MRVNTSACADAAPQLMSFGFIFPRPAGHINPSLPIARCLVKRGHQVHYLTREQHREAVEDSGATFHNEIEELTELHEGRTPSFWGAHVGPDHGLEGASDHMAYFMLGEIVVELMLPGVLRWLQKVRAKMLFCCSILSMEACYASKVAGIPCVGLDTVGGPGSYTKILAAALGRQGVTADELCTWRSSFTPLQDCLSRLRRNYGLTLPANGWFRPFGLLPGILQSSLTLVTTVEDLAEPMSQELAHVYKGAGSKIEYVGPLLDELDAKRAAGFKLKADEATLTGTSGEAIAKAPLEALEAAKSAGRKAIYVSMGTVLVGDSERGWAGRLAVDGVKKGLSGKELCQAAWGGVFDAFGSEKADEGPLLLVSLGPQDDALDDSLKAPPNSLCQPAMPQVCLLKAGVDLFLTHGGQNSFMESLSAGVPMVVCPGVPGGDQTANARKAVDIGVGLQIERPFPEIADVAAAVAAYRKSTATALKEVLTNPVFAAAAKKSAEDLRMAGGVPRAVECLLELASDAAKRSPSPANGCSRKRKLEHSEPEPPTRPG
eukprot:TRINITY_DN40269_c0_g1_i1.p1 TRINITY_DN40269_c0_g1~~TRINITY_DN40269_c0_g1_i1.p1  ORF type:complete len:546 (-),score=92.00 TRINITY_DN40269_c0_g1_i1:1-1638(-)